MVTRPGWSIALIILIKIESSFLIRTFFIGVIISPGIIQEILALRSTRCLAIVKINEDIIKRKFHSNESKWCNDEPDSKFSDAFVAQSKRAYVLGLSTDPGAVGAFVPTFGRSPTDRILRRDAHCSTRVPSSSLALFLSLPRPREPLITSRTAEFFPLFFYSRKTPGTDLWFYGWPTAVFCLWFYISIDLRTRMKLWVQNRPKRTFLRGVLSSLPLPITDSSLP